MNVAVVIDIAKVEEVGRAHAHGASTFHDLIVTVFEQVGQAVAAPGATGDIIQTYGVTVGSWELVP